MPPKRRPSAGGRKSLGKNVTSPEKAPEVDPAQVTKLKVANQKLTNELDETRQQLEKLQNQKNNEAQSVAESEEGKNYYFFMTNIVSLLNIKRRLLDKSFLE